MREIAGIISKYIKSCTSLSRGAFLGGGEEKIDFKIGN
jgi:hypothetical protein